MSHKEEYCECPDIQFPHKHTGANYPFKESVKPSIPGVEWEMKLRQKIEKEFDEGEDIGNAPHNWNEDNIKGYNVAKNELRHYIGYSIHSTLERYKRELVGKIEKLEKESNHLDNYGDCIKEILDLITKTK